MKTKRHQLLVRFLTIALFSSLMAVGVPDAKAQITFSDQIIDGIPPGPLDPLAGDNPPNFIKLPVDATVNDNVLATSNQTAVAGRIVQTAKSQGINTDFLLPFLLIDDSQEARRFLDALSGSTFPNSLQATILSSQAVNTLIQNRFESARSSTPEEVIVEPVISGKAPVIDDKAPVVVPDGPTITPWVQGIGVWGEGDSDQNAAGFDQTTGGVGFGLDYDLGGGNLIGLFGTWMEDDIGFDRGLGQTVVDTWQVGAYGQINTDNWYANGNIAYGWNDYSSSRRIAYLGRVDRLQGDFSGNTLSGYGEAGLSFEAGNGLTVEPFVGLGFVSADTDSFTERGSGPYALDVSDNSGQSLTGNLGVRAAYDFLLGATPVTVDGIVAWQHEFEDTYQTANASFDSIGSGGFTVEGTHFDRDSVVAGGGITAQVMDNLEAYLNYSGRFSGDYSAHGLFGGVGIAW